ncbi:FusB/FusC family EF-G-binding protein [Paenibacillus crassostreae]|uniref:Elongation factor G-binding protein n=1 Tax=Paenibacillus crassostreae TaxID=1763538 RepID=A0A167FZX4_9BACL|nr:FusB/FusC family EF-G-binding protein [Paenibacillus crassostreae]AOZ93901.1 elongation factor G-binding protein [Paenibacillus crassostreae]OAB77067.1 elongation factor G-binding protein [Paenibacillus crassostreae]
MVNPFIRNNQYNLIKKQVGLLQHACNTVSDPKVIEAVRYSAQSKIIDALPGITEFQKQMLENISTLNTSGEFHQYLRSLEPYMEEFKQVSEKQIIKLFPKIKKMKVPDLTEIDYRYMTYLGWNDIALNKLFLVYYLNGKLVGVEGKCTPANKKGFCLFCKRYEEVAFLSVITKSKPANATPDYYKAIGNYVCVNSETCNKNITDVSALEKFIHNSW